MPLEVVRTSSVKRLDPREDAPVWHDTYARDEKRFLMNGHVDPPTKALAAGFTAVNSDHRITSFRPDDSAKTALLARDDGNSTADDHSRPSSREHPVEIKDDDDRKDKQIHPEKKKRRRTESTSEETKHGLSNGISLSHEASPERGAVVTKSSSAESTASPERDDRRQPAKHERRESELIPFAVYR